MSAHIAKAHIVLALSASILIGPSWSARAQDTTKLRLENENSTVFIHSRRIKKDGTGVPENSYGAGFIVSELGHVLTARHVILKPDAQSIVETVGSIRSRHGQKYPLELVKPDDDIDVALLVFPDVGIEWKPVKFGDSNAVPKDGPLYALGFPGTFDLTPASGILSNRYGPHGIWQTTLPINRGHSGGPVFDLTGKVVAIASAGSDEYQAITFAIPERHARGVIQMAATVRFTDVALTSLSVPLVDKQPLLQKFTFYRAVDHEAQTQAREPYCVPEGYRITDVKPQITTQNGSETRLVSISPDPNKRNCVTLSAFIKGSGVDRVGPIVVNYKGRGWLGVDVLVSAIPEK
jgi:S1-C subfamily serine protease